jgi:hypothetical protein
VANLALAVLVRCARHILRERNLTLIVLCHTETTRDGALLQGCVWFNLNIFVKNTALHYLDTTLYYTGVSNKRVIDRTLVLDCDIIPYDAVFDLDTGANMAAFPDD